LIVGGYWNALVGSPATIDHLVHDYENAPGVEWVNAEKQKT
jgi:hypothetical protein